MPKRRTKRDSLRPALSRTELFSVRLAFCLAMAVAVYLAFSASRGGPVPGCGPESECDKVLGSRWAYVFGLPVSALALPLYLLILIFTFEKTLRWKVLLPLAGTVLLGALWFVGLQAFALRAFCKFCLTAHVAGALGALVLLRNNPLNARRTLASIGLSGALVAILIAAQMASAPPSPVQLVSAERPSPQTNAAVPAVPSNGSSVLDPTFTIVNGQVTLHLTNFPVSGRLDAPKKMVKLFDFTCHHCRDLHHLMKPVKARYANDLAVISLPMPLDASCNPALSSTPPAHVHACEYARLALALFIADRTKFDEFADWLFEPERPPDLTAARARAEELAGREAFEAASRDPRVDELLRTDISIYMATRKISGSGAMPQLLFERGGSIGAVRSAEALDKILAEALSLGEANATNAPVRGP